MNRVLGQHRGRIARRLLLAPAAVTMLIATAAPAGAWTLPAHSSHASFAPMHRHAAKSIRGGHRQAAGFRDLGRKVGAAVA